MHNFKLHFYHQRIPFCKGISLLFHFPRNTISKNNKAINYTLSQDLVFNMKGKNSLDRIILHKITKQNEFKSERFLWDVYICLFCCCSD